ncbi:MAG TPA: hypothetical protein VN976_21835 [Verrucomicrobiae bacterium]|nr:hypothetical protein [Verrucomicrobiae bacterium]
MKVESDFWAVVGFNAGFLIFGLRWVAGSLKGISIAHRRTQAMLNMPEWADTDDKKRLAAELIRPGGR